MSQLIEGQPKKFHSSFHFFCKTHRPEIKKNNECLTPNQVSQKLELMWQNATPIQKKDYEILADADKERYTKEKAAFDAKNKNKK